MIGFPELTGFIWGSWCNTVVVLPTCSQLPSFCVVVLSSSMLSLDVTFSLPFMEQMGRDVDATPSGHSVLHIHTYAGGPLHKSLVKKLDYLSRLPGTVINEVSLGPFPSDKCLSLVRPIFYLAPL